MVAAWFTPDILEARRQRRRATRRHHAAAEPGPYFTATITWGTGAGTSDGFTGFWSGEDPFGSITTAEAAGATIIGVYQGSGSNFFLHIESEDEYRLIEGGWVRLVLTDRTIGFKLGEGTASTTAGWSDNGAGSALRDDLAPADGDLVGVELWSVEPPPIFEGIITWGFEDPDDTTGADSGWDGRWYRTFGSIAAVSGGSVHAGTGFIDDDTVDITRPPITLEAILRYRVDGIPAIPGQMQAWIGSGDHRLYDGTWIKVELPDGIVYGRVTTRTQIISWNSYYNFDEIASTVHFTDDLVPPAGTQVPVSIWSHNPNPL